MFLGVKWRLSRFGGWIRRWSEGGAPERRRDSPLAVEGLNLGLTVEEIEGRERPVSG